MDTAQFRNFRLVLRLSFAPPRSSRICDPAAHVNTNLAVSTDDVSPNEERISPCKRLGVDDDFVDTEIPMTKRRQSEESKLNEVTILWSVSHEVRTKPTVRVVPCEWDLQCCKGQHVTLILSGNSSRRTEESGTEKEKNDQGNRQQLSSIIFVDKVASPIANWQRSSSSSCDRTMATTSLPTVRRCIAPSPGPHPVRLVSSSAQACAVAGNTCIRICRSGHGDNVAWPPASN